MPLVVPEISENDQAVWASKLLGKKLTTENTATTESVFAVKDLPEQHRVIKPNHAVTCDFVPERLNVYVDDSDKVIDVKHG